ncbi:MAG: tripartite tricarboxylate transporter substrate binding protein [Bacillota bacterium]|uniref:Tripartite tricarboxylate transporter substrate binding protein n=1 Tax=Virgibacillus salarius TaxID=447199 RepID=A0A941DXD4_9BACI|nr:MULTISPECIES: tripartite tricarboxylate transporter substrate-binding protein [Bacillaceae]MBR7796874.1 tripartite tricarboxylate transporter substrate binding protein [Virgibacillus salarius]MDY7044665.1 tripartite tricarboxylate transporter substrate-binding protein [Virgibacillus sp. M23]NAZ09584.1 tripartite tricarboxylate transporter substrate binding protein [Agaribacter marinus]
MKRWITLIGFLVIILTVTACSGKDEKATGSSGDWTPEKPIEIIAPAGAGGGWDTTARMAAKVFTEEGLIDQDIGVVNKPGGGGAVGWAYIAGKQKSSYNLFVSSPPIVLIPLNGQSEYGHEDFTPLANMIADYAAFAVSADAKWDNLNDLFEDMKKDPASITVVGASSPGSMDHIQFIQIAKAAGVDVTKIKYVSDQEGGGLTQVLNGSADVYSTGVAETVEQVKAGKIKVLGVSSEERLEGEVIEDFPTANEQGIDATFVNWRGFFGPPDMDDAAVKYYEEKFKELSDSQAFADIREQYGWDEMYMDSKSYKSFLDEQKEEIQSLLDELGLSK